MGISDSLCRDRCKVVICAHQYFYVQQQLLRGEIAKGESARRRTSQAAKETRGEQARGEPEPAKR